jgi:hypothetical protein
VVGYGTHCPPWCGGGHLCTARYGYPRGEHRSEPITVRTPYGVVVCSRVQSISGRGRLEIRLQVDLDPDERRAGVQAVQVAEDVDQAVRVALVTARRDPRRLPRQER